MKYILPLFFSLFLSPCILASQIEYKISYPHGLYKFALTIAGSPRESKTLLDIAREKKVYEIVSASELEDLKEVIFYLTKSHDLSHESYRSFSLDDIFTIKSMQANDSDNFKERTLGMLPLKLHNQLFSVLLKLEPFYKKEIWNSSMTHLLAKKKSFEELSKKVNLEKNFQMLKTIYQSDWPEKQNFIVALAPIPAKEGHSTASSLGIAQSVGVLTLENDTASHFGVIVHEMAHAIYNEQSPPTRKRWQDWINKNSDNKKLAQLFTSNYNEVFATIIGNGYIYEVLQGKQDLTPWYNDEIINSLAKLLYEDFKEYIINKKPLDENFFKNALIRINLQAPELLKLFDLYLKDVALMSNLEDNTKASRDHFREIFHARSIYGHNEIKGNYLQNLDKYIGENHTPVIVSNNKSNFNEIDHRFNAKNKKKLQKFIKSKDKVAFIENDEVTYFLFYAKNTDELKSELEKLKEKKYIK